MKIHPFLDHTALLLPDGKPEITVLPAAKGTLEIEGRRLAVGTGTVFHPMRDLIGQVRVAFVTEKGARYVAVRPYMAEGIPVSRVDYAAAYADVRIHTDALERQVDKLTQAVRELRTDQKHDALGFLTHNTKKQEVEGEN